MATRLYPIVPGSSEDTATAISPTPSTSWEKTTGFDRILARTTKPTAAGSGSYDVTGNGTNPNDILMVQVISGPWNATNLTGNYKAVWRARENNLATNARAQVNVRAFSLAGAELAVLIAHDTGALSNEFPNGPVETRRFPVGYTGSGVAISNGNIAVPFYLVEEFGARLTSTDTTNDVRLTHCDDPTALSDASETEGTTGAVLAWSEFSNTLSPYVEATPTVAAGTGAALTAKNSIKPVVTVASGTGAALQPQISFLPPPRTMVINGVDYTDKVRWDSWTFTECASRGEVGIGGLQLDDSALAVTVPAMKAFSFQEPQAGGSNKYVFSGYTHDRRTERGPNKVAGQRQWGVEVVDLNTLVDDYVLTNAESADRPAETDYVRVAWLLTSRLNSVANVGVGIVPNTNTVNMDAMDYRGRTARDVLNECSEMAGKNWFIYLYTGTQPLLFYDVTSGSNLTSTSKISDVATDVDSSTTWAVIGPPVVHKSPDEIYSTVHLTYNGGTVSVTNATTASTYRTREIPVTDMSVDTSAKATAKANAFLAASASEKTRVDSVSVRVPAANVNDFRAGQRFQLKLARHDITSFTYYRIIRREIRPLNDVEYLVTLTLSDQILPTIYNNQRGGDVYGIWEKKSNATDDGATVIVDRGGISIIDGALTVVNTGGTVIIDGESNMFKIAATGTLSVSAAAWAAGSLTTDFDSVTLSALGTWTDPPLHHSILSTAAATSDLREIGHTFINYGGPQYTATSSGGSPTLRTVAFSSWAYVYTRLDGSDQAQVFLFINNAQASTQDMSARYHVLLEASI